MLIKEYRIPLPLTVEEYRIAQLYMIAKKSREESSGAGSGVEILINEPYEEGPGGKGQYTRKVYHVGSHLPGWFKGLLPKSALTVEEEAWNAYPYTKTRYTCPFVEKFSLEIETYYYADDGHQDNVFNLAGSDYRNRIVDVIDVVKDQLYGADYVREEDPKFYISEKTNRGPLNDSWLEYYWNNVKDKPQPTPDGLALMCAYKLCRVEFRYWGMQTKLEKFIHDVALRKTMLRAHRQAWAWQDEWHNLTMDDIREIERQTQLALRNKMNNNSEDTETTEDAVDKNEGDDKKSNADNISISSANKNRKSVAVKMSGIAKPKQKVSPRASKKSTTSTDTNNTNKSTDSEDDLLSDQVSRSSIGINQNPIDWRLVRRDSDESCTEDSDEDDDEEFFDCQGEMAVEATSLAKWSSLELLMEEDLDGSPLTDDSIFSPSYRMSAKAGRVPRGGVGDSPATSVSSAGPSPSRVGRDFDDNSCPTTVLILVLHAGSVLDAQVDPTSKKSDVLTFVGALECVVKQHYPALLGRIAVRLVDCQSICAHSIAVLNSLSPYSFDTSPISTGGASAFQQQNDREWSNAGATQDSIPIGAIPLLATNTQEYHEIVHKTIMSTNNVYNEFLKCSEGRGFCGQVCLIGDSVGSILCFDALCKTSQRRDSDSSIILDNAEIPVCIDGNLENEIDAQRLLQAPAARRRSSSISEVSNASVRFDFDVSDFFMFGSPLALVLAARRISDDKNGTIPRPQCTQIYNLFHLTDPTAVRLEPLLSARFKHLPPVGVARYAKYPLGNGQPYHLLELIQSNPQLFTDNFGPTSSGHNQSRRLSDVSIQSSVSGLMDNIPLQTINALQQKWWGTKRLDYALYCPEGLANFPTNALPHLFHASYWESLDVVAFILRQVGRLDPSSLAGYDDSPFSFQTGFTSNNAVSDSASTFKPMRAREKWLRRRTGVKLRSAAANHRANDALAGEGAEQKLVARFAYGPLDVIALAGELVDVHISDGSATANAGNAGEWNYLGTVLTDKTGRATFTIPQDKAMGYGLHPVKMVVRGDHTCVDFYLAVVPPQTECVVFSVDGSFTASVSVTGKDPKVRAGAVDIVRHWQELGYLIVYVTGRPDMQQRRVLAWLCQHNFPHGLVSFADGLSTDPLGHKAAYLNGLITNHGVIIHQAYGSAKDITVYTNIGLTPKQIYIVGKVSKKHHSQATVLSDGYAAHLAQLCSQGHARAAQGHRALLPRGHFVLPGQFAGANNSLRRRRSAKRTKSYPVMDEACSLQRSMSTRLPCVKSQLPTQICLYQGQQNIASQICQYQPQPNVGPPQYQSQLSNVKIQSKAGKPARTPSEEEK